MQAVTRKKRITAVDLRARGPLVARTLALLLLIGGGIFVGVSYYKMRHNTPFRLRSEAPALSNEIEGIINGYERRITKDDRLFMWLRAARDIKYTDGHHELEQVNLQIFPPAGDKPDQIVSDRSIYEEKTGLLQFNGNVQIETRDALKVKTDSILFHQDTKIAETNAPMTFERQNVSGQAIGALVDGDKKHLELRSAVAITVQPEALKDANAQPGKKLTGANIVDINFQVQADRSVIKEMRTEGRSVATMSAPKSRANDPRAASKRLTADAIKLIWRSNGKDLEHSEAVGNAELYVEPVQKTAKNDRKTVTASRLDCDFYEVGNMARYCSGAGGSKVVLDPFQPSDKRGMRTITSDKMLAFFVRETQDIEKIEANGDAKFNELDRNGIANNVAYTASDETVRLRGGDPTVWDSRARTKAVEIDSNNETHVSIFRGKVQTTYYSQEQTNGASPFRKVKSPVYVSGDRAEIDHDSGRAVYSGSARMWQDDNYVRGDSLTLYREERRMETWGHVQSALYQAKQTTGNATAVVPAFATAEFMRYSDPERLLHYENNVDIKQGTDRMTSGVADGYLQKDVNEVERTISQRSVTIIQPGRRGTGDWCQYTTTDEVAVLTGNPAHVEDAEQGTTDGNRLTMYSRENRVVVDDARGSQSPGRVHSTHKITKP